MPPSVCFGMGSIQGVGTEGVVSGGMSPVPDPLFFVSLLFENRMLSRLLIRTLHSFTMHMFPLTLLVWVLLDLLGRIESLFPHINQYPCPGFAGSGSVSTHKEHTSVITNSSNPTTWSMASLIRGLPLRFTS